MEQPEVDKNSGSEETGQLNRNRSFKSKQLVRSQAIRESHSPPRTASPSSPSVVVDEADVTAADDVTVAHDVTAADDITAVDDVTAIDDVIEDKTSQSEDRCEESSECHDECAKKQPVEIQITPGAWDEPNSDQRQRTKRWLGNKQNSRDLLSNNPRVACVCGACNACPHCRGRRRRHACPTKQDSGIVCSDDCPDCSDTETSGGSTSNDGSRKTGSLDVDDQTFYCRCPDRKDKPKSISLSRTDSEEKSEPSGPELVAFIKETLNKNGRDRLTLLKIERELHSLINDTGRCIVRFPVMTSYGRMLVHRCAALFQLSHHVDQANKNAVTVSKSGTSGGRIPCTQFKKWCIATFPPSPQRLHSDSTLAKSILKRDTHSLDEPGNGSLNSARSKSLEQREREYERVRRRIFSSDNCTQDESSQWQWLNSGPIKVLAPEGGRNKLLKVQSLESSGPTVSTTSGSTGRGAVSKSHSFGGYGRAHDPPRVLSRQGDLASSSWRLSPSSSGYRTLSLHSTDSVTPSPTGGASPEPIVHSSEHMAVVWAVTDLSSVPPGALVIHPQTGRPLTNPDGSVYHFDPDNPPLLGDDVYVPEQKVEVNTEKKRGRLEKQQSFMDNECECQPSDECRSKCCCECRRHDSCQRSATDKTSSQPEQKVHQKPPSPCKNRYEHPPTPTNHNPPPDITTNHRPAYDTTTNQKAITDNSVNQRAYEPNQHYSPSPNLRHGFEIRNPYETNHRQDRPFEIQRPPSYDPNQKYEFANHRAPELANHRPMKLPTPEVQYIAQQYQQAFSHDEVTSPPQMGPQHYVHQEMVGPMTQIKHLPLADPNMRPLSLGVVYGGGGGYLGSPLPMYGTLLQASMEDQKPSEHGHNAHSMGCAAPRIDPAYQYAPMEYQQCAPGIEATTPRPYAVYAPIEQPMQYPHTQHHYQYQEPALQWPSMQPVMAVPGGKLFVPDLYPVVQQPYPQYNVVYPQMLPQQYPVWQPMCPAVDKTMEQRRNSAASSQRHSKRNSVSGSSRNTPPTTISPPDDKRAPYEDAQCSTTSVNFPAPTSSGPAVNQHTTASTQNRDSNEIAAKIQQIKDQMAQMNTKDKDRDRDRDKRERGREDWKRRNSGNGILGSYPVGGFNGRIVGRPHEDAQLSSAARAIVNSIRTMQAKNTYQDRRPEYKQVPYRELDRDRRRPDERADRQPDTDRRMPQYRPSYLLRQMSPGTWCRRSPGSINPVVNNSPRRPPPDTRNPRR